MAAGLRTRLKAFHPGTLGGRFALRGLAAFALWLVIVGLARVEAGDVAAPLSPQVKTKDDASSEASCRLASQSLWLRAASGQSLCLKYYRSDAGGPGPLALTVFADRHMIGPMRADSLPVPAAVPDIRASLTAQAVAWSRLAHMPVIILARAGNFGSSGDADRDIGSRTEVDFIASALDQLKSRLALKGFHLTGIGSGGNLAATLGLVRTDTACIVTGGAWLSERDRLAETGELFAPATLRATNDPLAEIARLRPHAGLRMIALVDPADPDTPDSALSAFTDAAGGHDVQVRRIALPALTPDPKRAELTIRAAIGCASGAPDQQIEALLREPAETAQTPAPAPPVLKPIGELILPQIRPQFAPSGPQKPRAPAQQAIGPIDPPAPPAQIQPQRAAPPVLPQNAPPGVAPKPDAATFSRADLIFGKSIDEPACAAIPSAIWVTSVGSPECIRYYYSDVGGASSRALVFFNGDFTYRGPDGQPTVDPDYARLGPADLQTVADVRSRDYGGPMIYLARPGTLGSSGYELVIRHSPREVALVAAALTEIKRRHGIKTFDLIGHSGGGLLVGALVSQRSDIACAVSSSGVLATNAWTSQRLNIPQTNSGFLYDPLEHAGEIQPGPGFRYIFLTDAADITVSASSTQLYLDALAADGIPYLHVDLTAADEAHHDLALHGFRAAIGCAHGMTDAEITAVLTKTVVTNRRMSELSPLGDMPEQPVTDKGAPAPVASPRTP